MNINNEISGRNKELKGMRIYTLTLKGRKNAQACVTESQKSNWRGIHAWVEKSSRGWYNVAYTANTDKLQEDFGRFLSIFNRYYLYF